MKENKNFNKNEEPVVFISPLDWGLGHATRCIPLIKEFQNQRCKVIIGTGNKTRRLLEQEFPDLPFLFLPDYNIRYSKRKLMLIPVLMMQIPRVLFAMRKERKLLNQYVQEHGITFVLSDNRFALYSSRAYSIYMTHQLQILSPSHFVSKLATLVHQNFIFRFRECWVPDTSNCSLAGKMSSRKGGGFPVSYLGPLSRLEAHAFEPVYDVCMSISGPEPQRTILENRLLEQAALTDLRIILLRGLPDQQDELSPVNPNITIKNHLPANELGRVFQQSRMIIARSGYTTIMDLVQIQKRAVLIPTPGQYEQEYLAKSLQDKQLFLYREQQTFSLKEAKEAFGNFKFAPLPKPAESYKNVISLLLKKIST